MSDSASSQSSPPVLLALTHDPSRDLLADRLRREDVPVEWVVDGTAAQRMIQDETFGVVVAEPHLPGHTGLELLQFFPTLQPPFVMMGRRRNAKEVSRAFELGAADYLTLPFSPRIATARILRIPRLVSTAAEARTVSK